MTRETEMVLLLLRAGLRTERPGDGALAERLLVGAVDWTAVYRQAVTQGVSAIVRDGLERLVAQGVLSEEMLPPRSLKIQWAFHVEQIEKRYERQFRAAAKLAAAYADAGIRTVVLKGVGVSLCYPQPNHRECGDFDCYLCGAYDAGNRIARELGAQVEDEGYKHSHILFHGLTVENHRHCLASRDDGRLKRLEEYIQRLAADDPAPEYVAGTKIALPPVDFAALFLTQHAFHHFLVEGISLRHVADWGLFLERYGDRVDWPDFYRWCERCDLAVFADAVTAVAVDALGMRLPHSGIRTDRRYAERILRDTLDGTGHLYNRGFGTWRERWEKVRNLWRYRWKYRLIYGRSGFVELLRKVRGVFFR